MTSNEWTKQIYNIIRPSLYEEAEFDAKRFAGSYWLHNGDYEDDRLVACTDGVGSKTKLAFQLNKLDTIGIDLVAMNVNDLIADFAKPMFFLDYIGVHSLDKNQLCDILTGIVNGCRQAHCALIGGETAEIPATYPANDASLVGFAVGMGAREPRYPEEDNIVIGYPSSGLHSNGFTLIHKLIDEGKLERTEELLTPTTIYTDLQKIFDYKGVRSLAHITGGGLQENIIRILPDYLMVDICPQLWKEHRPPIYDQLEELVPHDTMYQIFNMGIGFVAIVNAGCSDLVRSKTAHLHPIEIGMVYNRDSDKGTNFKQVEFLEK